MVGDNLGMQRESILFYHVLALFYLVTANVLYGYVPSSSKLTCTVHVAIDIPLTFAAVN